ncbi:MAG: transcription antitermination factor NusB [Gammaproteobacteria bacterium]|jgi:N utilization substance protein B|nr:transcription antitermination factor NusB [Gammaproteobacteria bacterium]MDP7271080.1 transcription antitermination factor NusB [Gammaproteobacteria bacterium]HJP04416.1 transcription antitermination factor NusB [Gammaproteobacteria bacterium]
MAAQGRHGARQLLVQAFYQSQLSGHAGSELLEQFADHPDIGKSDRAYFEQLIEQIEESRATLDAHITEFGDIPAEQLDPVERAVLWIALAEFCFQPDVPANVILNEAVELAKLYGAEGGYRYINGLLDKASTNLRPADV